MAKHTRETSGDPATPDAPETRSAITVVGIGASAGGLAALKAFFHQVPEGSGLAYVVVVHLAPDHESHLAELLQPHVAMPVQQVTESMRLERDHVYVIPPGRNLSAVDTHLRLAELEARRRERAPIDHFFRTLAATYDGASVGVVLTGTGSDGTLGVQEIKGRNGLVVVQDPAEAEYDGMPQSAVATGLADLVLPLAEIPGAILAFAHTRPRVEVPAAEEPQAEERQLLYRIFALVRARTGRDFSRYKRSTLLRRVARRMQLRHVEELGAYLTILHEQPEEVHALANDLLITVTNFFRDPAVFERLAGEEIPRLFEGRGRDEDLRVWSVGCATGEEAYSLAILLLEEAARHAALPRLQVFASDIHEHSLARAREGFYPGDIETDVSAERLARFFVKEDGGYRVRKEVRELVVFAQHNLLGDPPFSRLDLVTCRNVLIYLQRDVQREIVELFHYALRPEGSLLLGRSEAVDGTELFGVVDKRLCIYRKRNVPAPQLRLPVFPIAPARPGGGGPRPEGPGEPLVHGQLHQRLVERFAPPSLLVSPDDNVVHLSQHAGRYLVHPGGEPTQNVYRLVREELRLELRAALHAARERGEGRRSRPIPVRFDGAHAPVVVHVRPALDPHQEGFALVIFDEREASSDDPPGAPAPVDGTRARELEAELELMRHRLQSTIEEFETTQEELRSSNEEYQSANEELRSTLEELETSKEELQSINEELQTVNQENRHRVEELRQLTGDLQNFLAATDIATLFLDRELRILRYTPRVGELFNVRPADRGRPLSDLTHRLGYDGLREDARRVLDTLRPVEREVAQVAAEGERWYLTRLLPYRSPDDRIDGVVITFVDITAMKEADAGRRLSEARLQLVLDAADLGTWDLDLRRGTSVRSAAHDAMYGHAERPAVWDAAEAERFLLPEDVATYRAAFEQARETGVFACEVRVRRPDGGVRWIAPRGRVLHDEAGLPVRMIGVVADVTARKTAEGVAEDARRATARDDLRRALLAAEERERRRLARELHDEVGQHLAALGLGLQAAAAAAPPGSEVGQRIDALRALTDVLGRELHQVSSQLRPRALDDFGLGPTLESVAAEWSATTGTAADVHVRLGDARLTAAVETALFRIVQEALTNVARHADATRVGIMVERRDGHVRLTVEDDGRGFDPAMASGEGWAHPGDRGSAREPGEPGEPGEPRGLGLVGIRERVQLLGGALEIESAAGAGTTLFVRIPLEASGDRTSTD